jgi:MraZ protein
VLLVGTHDRRLDDKNRLALPAQFRSHFGDQCYVARGRKKCLDVVSVEDFERSGRDLLEAARRGEISENKLMAIAASAVLVAVDKQGRIVIDERLRTYAGIAAEQAVILSGRFDRFQLWAPERFAPLDADGTDLVAEEDDS